MKEHVPPPCGCHRPNPPCDCAPCPGKPTGENLLVQKIWGSGRLHQRRKCYPVSLSAFPCRPQEAMTLLHATVCGAPAWEEIPCCQRGAKLLSVVIPLSLEFRDCSGCHHQATATIEEQLRLQLFCPPGEAWRGQISLQAAVRLCGPVCLSPGDCPEIPLEVVLCGYLLIPCAAGLPQPPSCPPPKPWYPQPRYDPWQDTPPHGY